MAETRKEKILWGIGVFLIAGAATVWQIARWDHGQAWIVFRVWFIPIPLIVITGLIATSGFFYFAKGVFNK